MSQTWVGNRQERRCDKRGIGCHSHQGRVESCRGDEWHEHYYVVSTNWVEPVWSSNKMLRSYGAKESRQNFWSRLPRDGQINCIGQMRGLLELDLASGQLLRSYM